MSTHILIVEDENRIARFMSTILKSNGYDTMVASTGKEAVSMLGSYCPELVILDLGLPDMEGMDIIRATRSWSALPIIRSL